MVGKLKRYTNAIFSIISIMFFACFVAVLSNFVIGRVEVKAASGHSHSLCQQATCSHNETHEPLSWTGVSSLPTTLTSGNYYLTSNISVSSTITFAPRSTYYENTSLVANFKVPAGTTVNICLNGKKITNPSTNYNGFIFDVEYGATLNICDCSAGQTGSIETTTTTKLYENGLIYEEGNFNMFSGNLKGLGSYAAFPVTATAIYDASDGCKANIDTDGSLMRPIFNMYGGNISSNTAGYCVTIVGGRFNMYGGTLSSNNTDCIAKTLSLYYEAEAYIFGGTVTGGIASNCQSWEDFYGITKVCVIGGTVTSSQGPAIVSNYYGSDSDTIIIVTGGELTATGDSSTSIPGNFAIGGYNKTQVYVSGGTLNGKDGKTSSGDSGWWGPAFGGSGQTVTYTIPICLYDSACSCVLTGGKLSKNTSVTSYVKSGYKATVSGNYYIISIDDTNVERARVTYNSTTLSFAYFEDALIAASGIPGSTITAIAGDSIANPVTVFGEFTINLNGKTITGPTAQTDRNTIIIDRSSEINVINSTGSGSIQNTGNAYVFSNNGLLKISGGSFIGGSTGPIYNGETGETILTGGSYNTDVSDFVPTGYSCVRSGSMYNVTSGDASHTHAYVEHSGVTPTCTQTGSVTYYTCSGCEKYFIKQGTEYVEVPSTYDFSLPVDLNNHNLGATVQRVAPTCAQSGMQAHKRCTRCSQYFTVTGTLIEQSSLVLPVTNDHNYGTLVEEVKATCVAAGREAYYYCSICSHYFTSAQVPVEFSELTIPVNTATGHNYGTLVAGKEASCVEKGMESYYHCSLCLKYFNSEKVEKEYDQLIIPLSSNHPWGNLIDEEPATCVATGTLAHYYCPVCNKYFDTSGDRIARSNLTIEIDENAHNYGELIRALAPTCTQTGHVEHFKCSLCDKYFNADKEEVEWTDLEIAPIDHTYGLLIERKEKTCTEDGYAAHYRCSVCLKYFDEDKVEREFSLLVLPKGHIYGSLIPRKDPTCTQKGLAAHYQCVLCDCYFLDNGADKVQVELPILEIPLAPHDVELVEEVSPNCSYGIRAHFKCKNCGHFFEIDTENNCAGDEVVANDLKLEPVEEHSGGYWIIDKEPTTTEEGQRHKDCAVCGQTYITEITPKLPEEKSTTVIIASSAGGASLAIGATLFAGAMGKKKKKDKDDENNDKSQEVA